MVGKILKLFLLLLVLLTVIIFVAYKLALPVFVEKNLEKGLKREVSLDHINLYRLQAIELRNLVIYEKEGRGKFLQAKELNLGYKFQPLFQSLKEKRKYPKDWHLEGEISSPEIMIKGCQIRNLHLPVLLHESVLEAAEFRGDFYQGRLRGSFRLDLSASQPDYTLSADISRADLSGLVRDISSKREIEGRLRAEVFLRRDGDPSGLSGHGSVKIDEARLWEIPLLRGLTTLLHIPSYKKIVFDEVKGNFTIADGTVRTENLSLVSAQVKLLAKGTMDFQGKIKDRITVEVSFSKGFLEEVPLIGKSISSIIDEAGKLIAQVEVTGSIKEPKYRLVPLAPGIRDLLGIFGVKESE